MKASPLTCDLSLIIGLSHWSLVKGIGFAIVDESALDHIGGVEYCRYGLIALRSSWADPLMNLSVLERRDVRSGKQSRR